MTTIDAAAAWHERKLLAKAVLTIFAAGILSGCGTSSNLLSNNQAAAPAATVAQAPAARAAPVVPQRKIALAPVIGAPDQVAKPLGAQIATAMGAQRVPIAQAGESSDWTLRGYVVAANEKAGTKVSYIWDVTDASGKRVNRITGEETVAGKTKDPWSVMTPPLMQKIATRTADAVAKWLPTQQGAPQAGPAIAQAPSAAGGPVQTAAVATSAPPTRVASAAAGPTTGSLSANTSGSIVVAQVTKAPGDGANSLTAAIQRELKRSGVAIDNAAAAGGAYRVEGKVAVGTGKDGKQPIQIDWEVKDPKGKRLGTVSQKNEIAQGSLDGAWGQTADAAAAAAAQGIVKLLPATARTSTN